VKRGFKAEAERIATDTRLELGLKCTDQLDPIELAQHLEIPVVAMGELESHHSGRSDFSHYFSATDPDSFSAVTIFVGNYRRIIVHNENHHPHRQSSNISHEISHTLLEHVPTAIVGSNGQRFWDSEMEQEANWLAPLCWCLVKGRLNWHGVVPRRSKSRPTMVSANHSALGAWFKPGSPSN